MTDPESRVLPILLIHPDAAERRSLDEALRRVSPSPVAIYEAASLAAGLESVRRSDPRVIVLLLSEQPDLALDLARAVRRPDRLILGLYNPLLMQAPTVADFFRRAARAGVGDFVPLPAAEAELREALAAALAVPARETESSQGKLICFFSHKGGVGTSTLAASTALMLAEEREGGVVLCDAALQLGSAAALLHLAPELDVADLVRDLDTLEAISTYLTVEEESGLRVLASPRDPREAERISPEDLGRVLIALRRRFEVVVVDTPRILDLLTLAVLDLAETIFVVTEPLAPTVAATARLLDLLAEQGLAGERMRIVLNRYSSAEWNLRDRLVAEHLGRPVDHVVPYNEMVLLAASAGFPLVLRERRSNFTEAVSRLAQSVSGREPDATGPRRLLWR
jgi:pilus assembly protein CpaE